jgi:hypothetical protein
MLVFQLSSFPPSINQLYMTRGRYRVLTPEGRIWKAIAKQEILKQIEAHGLSGDVQALKGQSLCLVLRLHCPTWFTKAGGIRIKDAASYEKAAVDALFEALRVIETGLDDSQVFGLCLQKICSVEEKIEIEIMDIQVAIQAQ